MDEEFFNNELIENFEQMLDNREYKYYDSEDLIEIIEFYIDVNDNEYAKRALEYAEKLHPDNVDIKIKRIDYLLFNNNLKEASTKIKNLKEIASNNIDYLLVEARFWGMKNIPKKAIRLYEEALEIDDEETDFICNCIGNEYLNMGEIHSGLAAFKKALKFNPENDYSFYSIIQCYEEINNEKDYHKFLKDYIDDNPYSEAAWLHLGLLYNTQKKYNEAVNSFDYVIAINPSSITGHVHKAIALDSLGKYNDAIATLEETLEFDESPATTYLKIGKLYQKLNKLQEALKTFHICIKEDPQLDNAWANIASIYNQLSNHKEAEYYISRAIELDNKNINYYRSAAYYLLKQNKFEEAVDKLEKLIELDPLTFSSWFSYIEVLINIKEYEHAIAIITDGALKNFNRAELYYQLSNAYYKTNQEQLGDEALAKALLLNQSIKDDMFDAYPILHEKIINLKQKPF